jgi:Leucine-rich repeat (LRR) protein
MKRFVIFFLNRNYFKVLLFRRKLLCLVLLKILQTIHEVTSKQVACEKIDTFDIGGRFGKALTCSMTKTTSINETKVTISSKRDISVEGLTFSVNEKIFFLPENVDNNFPNLRIYCADNCSIKAVSKENFEGLNKLKFLLLQSNQIEKISSETFNDLVAIEFLVLGKIIIDPKIYDKLKNLNSFRRQQD